MTDHPCQFIEFREGDLDVWGTPGTDSEEDICGAPARFEWAYSPVEEGHPSSYWVCAEHFDALEQKFREYLERP
jgi:hypothetical protein